MIKNSKAGKYSDSCFYKSNKMNFLVLKNYGKIIKLQIPKTCSSLTIFLHLGVVPAAENRST